VIRICDLSKVFNPGDGNQRTALKSVNLTISQGEWCSLLGHNGSGKSTLLRIIAGEEQPTAGDLIVNGRSVLKDSAAERASTFLFVEQDTRGNLVPSMTIEENLTLATCRSKFPGLTPARRRPRRVQIIDALERLAMGLERRLDVQVRTLSGGERQAVVIAKALLAATPVLLLDEFLGAMDPKGGPLLLKIVRDLARTERLTVLSVTHNLEHVMAGRTPEDRVVMLRRGEIIAETEMAEIRDTEQLIEWYEKDAVRGWSTL